VVETNRASAEPATDRRLGHAHAEPEQSSRRAELEEIADRKFMRYEFEPDGTITIKSADVKFA